MVTMIDKLLTVVCMGINYFNSTSQPCSSSNSWDMDIQKSKMAGLRKPTKPTQFGIPVIDLGVISINSEIETCSSSNGQDMDIWKP